MGLKKPCQAQLWLIFIIITFIIQHFSTPLTQNYTANVDDMGKKKRLKNKKKLRTYRLYQNVFF